MKAVNRLATLQFSESTFKNVKENYEENTLNCGEIAQRHKKKNFLKAKYFGQAAACCWIPAVISFFNLRFCFAWEKTQNVWKNMLIR